MRVNQGDIKLEAMGWQWTGEVEKVYLPVRPQQKSRARTSLGTPEKECREGAWLQRALQFLAPGPCDTQQVLHDLHPLILPLRLKNELPLNVEASFICISAACNQTTLR